MGIMTQTQKADVLAAIELFERRVVAKDPDAAYSLGTITNRDHAFGPRGAGVCVTVHATIDGITDLAFAKARVSFVEAMLDAIDQLELRRWASR